LEVGEHLVDGSAFAAILRQLIATIVPSLPVGSQLVIITKNASFEQTWAAKRRLFEEWKLKQFRGRPNPELLAALDEFLKAKAITISASRRPVTQLEQRRLAECASRTDALRKTLRREEPGIAFLLPTDEEESAREEFTAALEQDGGASVRSLRSDPHPRDETCWFHTGHGWCLSRRAAQAGQP
jgi:hypothetical protein